MKSALTDVALADRAPFAVASRRQWLTLFMLTLTVMLSYTDRTLLAVLSESIKRDMKLTDTNLGLLTGFGFSFFYGVCSLPVARLGDRGYRRAGMVASVAIWSLFTSATGLCTMSWQLFLARFGVGAGEAGALPISHAILADTFAPSLRGTAMALFTVGAPIGMMVAFGLGGWLNVKVGWHETLILLGAAGLLVAAALYWMLPADRLTARRGASDRQLDAADIGLLLSDAAFVHLLMGIALFDALLFGQLQWTSAFFERSFPGHHATLGPLLASTRMASMVAGVLVGGFVSDRLSRGRIDVPITLMAIILGVGVVPQVASYLAPTLWQALALSAVAGFAASSIGAPGPLSILNVAPPHVRATASALGVLASAILGLGCGPLFIGYVSDLLTPHYGVQALRLSLIIANLILTPWMILHLLLARRRLRGRLAESNPSESPAPDAIAGLR